MTMRRSWSLINTEYTTIIAQLIIANCTRMIFLVDFCVLHLHCLLFYFNSLSSPLPPMSIWYGLFSLSIYAVHVRRSSLVLVSNSFFRLTLTSKQNVNKQSHHRHQTTTGGWFIDFVALFLALGSFADWRFLFFCFFIVCTHRQVHLISQVADSLSTLSCCFFAAFVICGRSIGRRLVCV